MSQHGTPLPVTAPCCRCGAHLQDEDFTSSYDGILADVEVPPHQLPYEPSSHPQALKREHKILSVYNETDRVQMVYLNPYQVPDDSFPWEMDPEIKDLWHRVPRVRC